MNGWAVEKIKLVGIDASLTSTGIAVNNGQGLLVSTENISSKKRGPERLIEIREEIRDMVVFADLVILEDYAYSRTNQAHQIGELGGVLRVMLFEMGKKVLLVSTNQLKKWGIECRTNDETDAAVLVYIGLAYMGNTDGLTAYQQEVIDALHRKSKVKKKAKKKK